MLSKTLALAEYDVDLASDGRTAVERLRIIPYDLLITDLKMPGVDGLAVIREARRLKADIPVIIITGFSTEASAIEAVNLGVSGYLDEAVSRSPGAGGRGQGLGGIAHGSMIQLSDPHQILRRSRAARVGELADRRSASA